jgi:hypothetical protein
LPTFQKNILSTSLGLKSKKTSSQQEVDSKQMVYYILTGFDDVNVNTVRLRFSGSSYQWLAPSTSKQHWL